MQDFGTYANLIISSCVVAFGLFWLLKKPLDDSQKLRIRSFQFWWASWLMWVIAWSLLTYKSSLTQNEVPNWVEIGVLIFDNFNTVFLVLMYFVLTRGNSYSTRRGYFDLLRLTFSLGIFYCLLYLVFGEYIDFAKSIHHTWSLSLGVITPILIGWAFKLRFNTRLVLYLGVLYGFMQPLLFTVQLKLDLDGELTEYLKRIKPVIDLLVALLKVFWAILCVKVLYSGFSHSKSLISSSHNKSFLFRKNWNPHLKIYSLLLLGVFIVLILYLVFRYATEYTKVIGDFAASISIVTGAITIFLFFMWILDRIEKKENV